MAATLEEVRKFFPTAKYAPLEGCKKCGGDGKLKIPKVDDHWHPCMCVFIAHDDLDLARDIFREVVKDHREHPEKMEKMVDDTVNAVRNFMDKRGMK